MGVGASAPFRAPGYETSLYFDDLHLASDAAAAQLIGPEARDGYERGQRAFKSRSGGARHLSLEQGTRHDIALVKAVRGGWFRGTDHAGCQQRLQSQPCQTWAR